MPRSRRFHIWLPAPQRLYPPRPLRRGYDPRPGWCARRGCDPDAVQARAMSQGRQRICVAPWRRRALLDPDHGRKRSRPRLDRGFRDPPGRTVGVAGSHPGGRLPRRPPAGAVRRLDAAAQCPVYKPAAGDTTNERDGRADCQRARCHELDRAGIGNPGVLVYRHGDTVHSALSWKYGKWSEIDMLQGSAECASNSDLHLHSLHCSVSG